jgi:hypothetical protein
MIPDNTNLNAIGSNYASQYGHQMTSDIARIFSGVRKRRKKKIANAAPEQFYSKDGFVNKLMNKE